MADHKLFDVVNVTVDTAFRYMYFTKQPMVATYCYLARMMTFFYAEAGWRDDPGHVPSCYRLLAR